MTTARVLLAILAALAAFFAWRWFRAERVGARGAAITNPGLLRVAIGFVTNFFDTLGIGSFAPTTAAFKFRRVVPDEWIPGTLNVGHTLPTMAAARYTGGLWVGSFLKTCTHQWLDPRGVAAVAPPAVRQSAREGLEGHRRAAALRLERLQLPAAE